MMLSITHHAKGCFMLFVITLSAQMGNNYVVHHTAMFTVVCNIIEFYPIFFVFDMR